MDLPLKLLLLKFFSLIWNIFFLALGLGLGGAGLWILFDSGTFISVAAFGPLDLAGLCLSLIGAMVILVSILGCLAVTLENQVLLLTNVAFLLVLVLGQVYVILLLLIDQQKIQENLVQTVGDIIINYGDQEKHNDSLLNKVQTEGKCCGISGPSDWLNNVFVRTLNLSEPEVLPCSCFGSFDPNARWCSELQNLTNPPIGAGNFNYTQGCKEQLQAWLQANLITILGMGGGLLLVLLVYLGLTGFLYRALTQKAVQEKPQPESGDKQPTEHVDEVHDMDSFHDNQRLIDQSMERNSSE